MTLLYNRDFSINVAGLLITTRPDEADVSRDTLKVVFRVTKTTAQEPNTADVSIHNLSKVSRVRLQQSKKLPVEIQAGYVGNRHVIFRGDLAFVQSMHDGTDWITSIQSGDGLNAWREGRINLSLKGPIKVGDALRKVVEASGFSAGKEVFDKLDAGNVRGALQEFKNGIVASGKTVREIEKLAKGMGLPWFVENNEIHFYEEKEVRKLDAVLLKPGTGLIGSPEAGEDGILKVRSLLQPDLMPARRVKVESREVDGFYKVQKVDFVGDTWGADWYSDVEASPL